MSKDPYKGTAYQDSLGENWIVRGVATKEAFVFLVKEDSLRQNHISLYKFFKEYKPKRRYL